MPYIITTTRTIIGGYTLPGERETMSTTARTAVATLEEAREAVFNTEAVTMAPTPIYNRIAEDLHELLSDAGLTVGPLPDGTVIEVRQVSWGDVVVACGTDDHGRYLIGPDVTNAHVLAAFNSQQ